MIVDEHHLVTRKYHVGNQLVTEGEMVWGAIDTGTVAHPNHKGKVVIVRLPNQTNQTLLDLIALHVAPQSIILSDGALMHRSEDLVDIGMHMHYWVNHSVPIYSEEIEDPLYGNLKVTTNHIERQWKELDKFIKSYQNNNHINQYIDQYMYWKNHDLAKKSDGEKFGNLLYDISRVYPGPLRHPCIDMNETLQEYYEP